jgi:hypothetical protein
MYCRLPLPSSRRDLEASRRADGYGTALLRQHWILPARSLLDDEQGGGGAKKKKERTETLKRNGKVEKLFS